MRSARASGKPEEALRCLPCIEGEQHFDSLRSSRAAHPAIQGKQRIASMNRLERDRRVAIVGSESSMLWAASILGSYKSGQKRNPASDAIGTVRCCRSLWRLCRGPSGTGLSSAIMPAPSVVAPTIVALDDLHLELSSVTCARASHFRAYSSCSGLSHKGADSLPHSLMCAECGKLSGSCIASAVQEE